MKLSIIIPVYNAEIYLENCISTVTACQESDMEIILVDDGSTDQSLAICQEVERKDPRIQVISKKNEGVSVARNTGMNIAKGNYLMFMDADDYMNEKEWATVWKEIQKIRILLHFPIIPYIRMAVIKKSHFRNSLRMESWTTYTAYYLRPLFCIPAGENFFA